MTADASPTPEAALKATLKAAPRSTRAARKPSPKAASKAARTRRSLIAAAERIFAEQGFDRTRLEDVARAVGIRRASIVYHFRDKRALYDSVLAELFDELAAEIERALTSEPAAPAARIEAAVSAWVTFVGARPAIARILLREIAEATAEHRAALVRRTRPIAELARDFLREWKRSPEPLPADVDPAQVASAIAGSTVFFVAAMPSLITEASFEPLDQLEQHRRHLLDITWCMLGIDPPASGRVNRALDEQPAGSAGATRAKNGLDRSSENSA